MERTQTLALDFTATQHGEAYVATFSGDMNSQVISLTVTPELEEGDILLCSFLRHNLVVDTLVIQNNCMTLPYSVLKEPGEYTAAFAVANLQNRLTAPMLLTVRVAEDRVSLAPTEDYTDQSLICYILTRAASTARAAAAEELVDINERMTQAESRISLTNTAVNLLSQRVGDAEHNITSLGGRVTQTEDDIDDLGSAVEQLATEKVSYAEGELTLTGPSQASCQYPFGRWMRLGNLVITAFGFCTAGTRTFSLAGMPFRAAFSYQNAALTHSDYNEGVSIPTDGKIDFCQTVAGSTSVTVVRQDTTTAVVAGTLVYYTDEPFPTESQQGGV